AEHAVGKLDDLTVDDAQALSLEAAHFRELTVNGATRLQHDDRATAAEAAGARAIVQLLVQLGVIAGFASLVRRRILTGDLRPAIVALRAPSRRRVGRQRQAENADGRCAARKSLSPLNHVQNLSKTRGLAPHRFA